MESNGSGRTNNESKGVKIMELTEDVRALLATSRKLMQGMSAPQPPSAAEESRSLDQAIEAIATRADLSKSQKERGIAALMRAKSRLSGL